MEQIIIIIFSYLPCRARVGEKKTKRRDPFRLHEVRCTWISCDIQEGFCPSCPRLLLSFDVVTLVQPLKMMDDVRHSMNRSEIVRKMLFNAIHPRGADSPSCVVMESRVAARFGEAGGEGIRAVF